MKFRLAVISVFSFFSCFAQSEKPKLVVGIVIDQMRYDYLTRFEARFGEDGFKKLINEGYNCQNHHFNYMPTYTGPGHASIYTGTAPENHGIIANNWYDKFIGEKVYCVQDSSVTALGTESEKECMSPHRMLSTTFADANRVHTQFKGKTIGISIKDRGAILPAGHAANHAFWFRGKEEGVWVSSTYYGKALPAWVTKFNTKKSIANYVKEWNTLYPIATYTSSGPDLNNYEHGFEGKETATFPYDLKTLKAKNAGYDILKYTPYGNAIVTDFALEAIKNEQLGKDEITDVLTVSYSSTDYIGHNFGVNSVEIEDTYLRLDKELARLIQNLDKQVGKGQYTLFLTADHGAVHVPQFLKDRKIPGYYIENVALQKGIEAFLASTFGVEGLLKNMSNQQLFLNYKLITDTPSLSLNKVTKALQHYMTQQPNVQYVFTRAELEARSMINSIGKLVQNGFHQRSSGDVAYVLTPATISYSKTGSTHGSPQVYDTHVPLLFYGKGIQKGKTFKKTAVTDIAPTISALLGIAAPNAATGDVLEFVIK